MKYFSALSLLFFLLACGNSGGSLDKTFYYYDGNGNGYKITADSLFYDPVDMSNSSSGYYSGGPKRTVALSGADRKTIINNLYAAASKPEIQQSRRKKGAGIISIEKDNHKERFIIRWKTEEQRLIEESLRAALIKK